MASFKSRQKASIMLTTATTISQYNLSIITLAIIVLTSTAAQAIKRDEYGQQSGQQQQVLPVYSSSVSISSSSSPSSSSSSPSSSSSQSSQSSSSSSSSSSPSAASLNNNQNSASIYSQQTGSSSSYSSPSSSSSGLSSSPSSSSAASSNNQYSSYSSRDASSSIPSMSNYGQSYSDHAVAGSSQSNSYQQAAASVNQALASSGLLNSLSASPPSGSMSSPSSGGSNGPNPASSSSGSPSTSNLAYYYYYPGSKEASQVMSSQQQQKHQSDPSSSSGGYQATNQYPSLLSFPSSSNAASSSVNMDSSALGSMSMSGAHGIGSLDTAASNQDASYMPQPDQYSNQQVTNSGNQNGMNGNNNQQQQQNQYQPIQQPYYSDYTSSSNGNGGNMMQQHSNSNSNNNNNNHLISSASGPSPQASSPSAYNDLSSYPSTLSQMSANQPGQQVSSSGAYQSSQASSSLSPFGGSQANNNQGQSSLGLNSNNLFSSSELTNAYNQAFNMPNGQANDQSPTFGSLAANSNPYASFAGLSGVGSQPQFQSNQFSSGLGSQNPFGAGPFGQQVAQAATNQYAGVAPNQQDQASSILSTNSRRHGIASYIMPLLAVAGLSLLIPTISQISTAVGRKKRSIGEGNDFVENTSDHQNAKETLISEYADRIKRYYSIYKSAVENDDCMNRLICELGDAVKEVRGKAAVVTVIEKLVPTWMTGKVHVFKDAALASEKGKCHKQFTCKVQL